MHAAAKDPGLALAHYSLALSAPTAKDFFQHLKQAVVLADKASEGERLMILGLEAGANADTKLQRDYYERLAAAYPRDERVHFLLGGAYFGAQNYPKAIGEYEKSVELAPDYAPAYNLLGAIALQEKKYDQALEELRQGNQQDPYTLYRIALAYQGKGDQTKAADFFRQAANQHTLPTFNYVFVRAKAKKMKA